MKIEQKTKGFVIRADQKDCEPTTTNTKFLRYIYLESFKKYLSNKNSTLIEYNWTAYGHKAKIFENRLDAIKVMKQLQLENAEYKSKVKYQVLTYKFVSHQNIIL